MEKVQDLTCGGCFVRRFLAIVAAGLLVGCAGRIIEKNMNDLVGQPASAVFARLGHPDAEAVVAGRKTYTWSTRRSGLDSVCRPAVYSGRKTVVPGSFDLVPYTSECRIRVLVDSRDVVQSWDHDGNEGGCERYAKRLEP